MSSPTLKDPILRILDTNLEKLNDLIFKFNEEIKKEEKTHQKITSIDENSSIFLSINKNKRKETAMSPLTFRLSIGEESEFEDVPYKGLQKNQEMKRIRSGSMDRLIKENRVNHSENCGHKKEIANLKQELLNEKKKNALLTQELSILNSKLKSLQNDKNKQNDSKDEIKSNKIENREEKEDNEGFNVIFGIALSIFGLE